MSELSWLPEELSFITEEESFISISPHFSSPRTTFLSGTYGPFQAGIPIKVPMWLAFFLNNSHSCTLIPPKWLTVSYLSKIKAYEQKNPALSKVPRNYMEVSFAFFLKAPTIVQKLDSVRSLVEDIWTLRVEKLRNSIIINSSAINDNFELPNVTRMELHLFREPVTKITELLTSMNALSQRDA